MVVNVSLSDSKPVLLLKVDSFNRTQSDSCMCNTKNSDIYLVLFLALSNDGVNLRRKLAQN